MGLDMYLGGVPKPQRGEGEPTMPTRWQHFGEWRKHWGLHAYLVNQFAGGMDEYNKKHFLSLKLSADDLRKVIAAIETEELEPQPKPKGYDPAIAKLYGEQTDSDTRIFRRALAWLEAPEGGESRAVYYEAND